MQLHAVDSVASCPERIPERSYAAYSSVPKSTACCPNSAPVPTVTLRRPCRNFGDLHTEVTAGKSRTWWRRARSTTAYAPPPFCGGRRAAKETLQRFLDDRLHRYARDKNEPSAHATSDLSPYLHYGHISSLEVALAVKDHAARHKLIAEEFLEELIVRRELAFNFRRYADHHDTLEALPEWARKTIADHCKDARSVYTREQFEAPTP